MVRKPLLAAIVAASMMLPMAAQAFYITSYTQWQRLSAEARQGIVMGGMDQLISIRGAGFAGKQTAGMHWRAGLIACLGQRIQANSVMMEQAVTDAYRANPDLWRVPVAPMIEYVATRMCETDINMAADVWNEPHIRANSLLEDMRRLARLIAQTPQQQQQQQQQSSRRR